MAEIEGTSSDRVCRRIEQLVTGSIIAGLFTVGAAICILVSCAERSHAEELAGAALTLSGTASWYGPGFHGRQTANGERYNMYELTAAHRSLPFGTRLKVVNETNGRSVVVRVNDRGPFAHRRIIDLAKGPAQALGLTSSGVGYVSLHRLD